MRCAVWKSSGTVTAAASEVSFTSEMKVLESGGTATREACVAIDAPPAPLSSGWVGSQRVLTILERYGQTSQSLAEIAEAAGLTVSAATRVIEGVSARAAQLKMARDVPSMLPDRVPVPDLRRVWADERWATMLRRWESGLEAMWRTDPQGCRQGIALHLDNVDRQVWDVKFRKAQRLMRYLDFLSTVGINASDVCFCLRIPKGVALELPGWCSPALANWKESRILRKAPKTNAASYAQWVGVLAVNETSSKAGMGWLIACLMSMVILDPVGQPGSSTLKNRPREGEPKEK